MPPIDPRTCGVSRSWKFVGGALVSGSLRLCGQGFFVHLSFIASWQSVKLLESLGGYRMIGFTP